MTKETNAPTTTSEPEREIHPDDEVSCATRAEVSACSYDLSDFNKTLHAEAETVCDQMSEDVCRLDSDVGKLGIVEKIKPSWSDDSSFRLEDIDSALYESISEIRKQTLHMDAVIAYEQLETMKQELTKAKRELHNKDERIGELCQLVLLKDKRIATLELERDLFRASHIKMDQKTNTISKRNVDLPSKVVAQADVQEECKQSFEANPVPVINQILLAPGKNKTSLEIPLQRSQSTIPSASIANRSIVSDISSDWSELTHRRSQHATQRVKKPTRSRFGSFGKRGKGTTPDLNNLDRSVVGTSSYTLQSYIESLQHKLNISIQNADELRKRLSMVNRYYEGLVRQLHTKMVSMEADRNRMHADLTIQIKNLDAAKQAALATIETASRQENQDGTTELHEN